MEPNHQFHELYDSFVQRRRKTFSLVLGWQILLTFWGLLVQKVIFNKIMNFFFQTQSSYRKQRTPYPNNSTILHGIPFPNKIHISFCFKNTPPLLSWNIPCSPHYWDTHLVVSYGHLCNFMVCREFPFLFGPHWFWRVQPAITPYLDSIFGRKEREKKRRKTTEW